MGKPLINTKQWTSNDVRMLVIAHFILVYPILAGSIFMVLLFFVLQPLSIWVKGYWLIASGAWLLLLAIVLPLMGGGPNEYYPTGTQRRPKKIKEHGSSTEKIPMTQNIRVEEAKMERINRDSFLTNESIQKSEISLSDGSVEKGTLEEKADKENCDKLRNSLNNSKENIKKSTDSIFTNDSLNEKKALTQSGEFLNDCIGELGDDSTKKDDVPNDDNHKPRYSYLHKEEIKKPDEVIGDKKYTTTDTLENDNKHDVVAVVHLQTHSPEKENKDDLMTGKEKNSAKMESKDDDSDIEMIHENNDLNEKLDEDKTKIGKTELNNDSKNDFDDNQKLDRKTEKIDSPMNKTFIVTPTPKDAIDKQLCQEAIIVDDDEEEEIGELVELPSLANRRNQDPPSNVDTSSANKFIVENTVSTPPSANSLSRRGSNVVHLFIKGD